MVHVGETVVDRKGNFLTTLEERDFEVYEDGQKQSLRFFVRCDAGSGGGDRRAPAAALHLGALFDISGSMGADMHLSRTAAIRFLDAALQDARDFTLVEFDTEVRVARYSQSESSAA